MEVVLILYMCSALQKTCLDPYIWPDRFYDKYGCMVEGYRESEKKIKEIEDDLPPFGHIDDGSAHIEKLEEVEENPWMIEYTNPS